MSSKDSKQDPKQRGASSSKVNSTSKAKSGKEKSPEGSKKIEEKGKHSTDAKGTGSPDDLSKSESSSSEAFPMTVAQIVEKVQAENKILVESMMNSMFEKLQQGFPGSGGSGNAPSTSTLKSHRANRWSDDYDDEKEDTMSDVLDVHAPSKGFEDSELGPIDQEQFVAQPLNRKACNPDDEDKLNTSDLTSNRGSGGSTQSNMTHMSKDHMKQIQWMSVMQQLPSYYNEGLVDEESSPAYASLLDDSFHHSHKQNVNPRLPLEGFAKQKWDAIQAFLKQGDVSPYTTTTSKKFQIKESDFEKYSRVPRIDPEYTAMMGATASKYKFKRGTTGQKTPKTDASIKDKNLRIAECDLQKCDESARVILRAASHGSLILNAANTVLKNPEQFQPEEALNLMQGVFQTFEAIADCAIRTTARSIAARRRIYLSQVTFKDSNAQKDLMKLPMDGGALFHGDYAPTLHKYATMARDAKETSDYAASSNLSKFPKRNAESSAQEPPFKKPATVPKPQFNRASPASASNSHTLQINKQGNMRNVSFGFGKNDKASGKKPFQFRKGNNNRQ